MKASSQTNIEVVITLRLTPKEQEELGNCLPHAWQGQYVPPVITQLLSAIMGQTVNGGA